ncbi:hypothetical protein NS228_16035 [Methylobacterium indicum]|uniref:hypothetical protein n=1 Tax=Methylobacterium indicum TaxID=1775910 RepID=UPI000733CB04|nr:hypothetical protein [Methylobacterium indicum]KTS21781.1 hypothetical protein NS229_23290 [Methylobacterium indicum]KTS39202.1 hypothetical protein NS228_16035 [Methylobacterium indicum]KTS44128.1 hypothetical protein NS230_25940 [Methylobacterium indicum]
MRSYNLFCLKSLDGLVCAVPEDYAVPAFVTEARWAFGGKLDGSTPRPLGFDGAAAATAVRFNGFYLFQSMGGGHG